MMRTITIPLLLNGKILWKVFLMILLTQEASVSHNTEPGQHAVLVTSPLFVTSWQTLLFSWQMLIRKLHPRTNYLNTGALIKCFLSHVSRSGQMECWMQWRWWGLGLGGGEIAAKLHISLSDEQESSLNGFEIEICQHPPEAGICAGGGDQIGGLFWEHGITWYHL